MSKQEHRLDIWAWIDEKGTIMSLLSSILLLLGVFLLSRYPALSILIMLLSTAVGVLVTVPHFIKAKRSEAARLEAERKKLEAAEAWLDNNVGNNVSGKTT